MIERMHIFTEQELTKLHDVTMQVLGELGVAFNEPEALDIFKANGFRVEGKTVFFTEEQVRKALDTCPETFTIKARNPEKSLKLGLRDYVTLPGYGAPFVSTLDGGQRSATMEDYDNFCKLVHTSQHITMNGFMMVEPHDLPPETVHLDMLFSSIVLSDKPFMGSPVSKRGAKDCVDMLAILYGGMDKLEDAPATVSLCNSLSPLQFSDEMAGSIIELARANQAVVVAALMMAGSSGPVTLPGVYVVQNAEALAGITLAQLVRPGAPVIYGSTSSAMDMRTGALAIGAPELSMNISAVTQLARFYKLPCRAGGGLTDSLIPDGQAGAESALALSTAIRGGVNFILHTAGILGSYISMSYEKFILDEEIAGMLGKMVKPLEINDESIDLATIKAVGVGGQYLTQPKTFQLCRTEFYNPALMSRANIASWKMEGSKSIAQAAADKASQRLATYEKPEIDPGVEQALAEFVAKRKKEYAA